MLSTPDSATVARLHIAHPLGRRIRTGECAAFTGTLELRRVRALARSGLMPYDLSSV